jgi:hypothetical protein
MRRLIGCLCLLCSLLFPVALHAGQIYGFIVKQDGAPLPSATIEISCGGAPIRGATAADGTYRINVPQQGPCTLTLPDYNKASAAIVSYPNPSEYKFQLVNNRLQRL